MDTKSLFVLLFLILAAVLAGLASRRIGGPSWHLGWAGLCSLVIAIIIEHV